MLWTASLDQLNQVDQNRFISMNNFYQVVGKGTVYQLWTACRFGWTVPSLRKYCRCIFWIIFIRYRYVYQLGAFNCRIGSTESSWSKEINFYEQFLTSTVCLSTWCFGPQVCICCWWWGLLYPGGSDHQPEDLEAVLHIGGCSGRRHSVNKGLTGRGGGDPRDVWLSWERKKLWSSCGGIFGEEIYAKNIQ